MNILVTVDSNYIRPLKVMLYSLFTTNHQHRFHIFLIFSRIKPEEIQDIEKFIPERGHDFSPITIRGHEFYDAPVLRHYSDAMYYRLLAFQYLPEELDRVLYLDPDILVINNIQPLYDEDLSRWMFAAAAHNRLLTKELNQVRVMEYELKEYFNSGVLLMNLPLQRKHMNEDDIFDFVEKYKNRLILPDQDVLNYLYSKNIKKLNEIKYNYDARYYRYYRLTSNGKVNMDYVMRNTVILHFCGKKKPWHENYSGEFHSLYKHYEKLAFG